MGDPPRLPGRGRVVLVGGIWLVGLLVVFVLGGYQSIASLNAKVALQVIAIVAIGGWAIAAIARPSLRPTSSLLVPIIGLCVAYGASALMSQRPRLSFEPGLAGLAFAGAYFALSGVLRDAWVRRRVAVLIVTLTAAVSIMYMAQVVVEWVQWWIAIGRLTFPPLRPAWAGLSFGSPNLVANFLVLLGPLAVALLPTLHAPRKAIWAVAVALLIALVLTGTRAAYLGLIAGTMFGFILIVVFSGASSVFHIPRRAIALGGAAAGVAALIALPAVLYRLGQGGDAIRFDLWRSAVTIFMQFPVFGAGPGTWVQLKTLANPAGVPNPVFSNAHSLYFQTGAELGVVGVAASAALVLAVMRLLARGTRTPGGISRETVAAGVGLVAFAVEAAFDTLTNLPMVCLLIAVVVAWIDAGVRAEADRPPSRVAVAIGRIVPVAALLAIVIAVPLLVRTDEAWAFANAGDEAALRGDWSTAAARYRAAHEHDPDFTLYDLEEASALARVGRLNEARARLEHAVHVDPVAINLLNLAALEHDLGDEAKAMGHVRQAMALGEGVPTVALNAGLLAEAMGDTSLALDRFAETVALVPELIESELWTAPERKVAENDVVAAAVARTNPLNASLIYAYDGRAATALDLVRAQPPSSGRDIYEAVVRWLGGDRQAGLAGLTARLDEDPLDWRAAAWVARLLRRAGEASAAVSYARWAYVVQADVALDVIFEKEIDLARAAPYAGLDRSYPTGVYLHPPSPDLVVPQLVPISAP